LNVFTDAASLLWRLSLAGKAGLEPHWREVAAYGDRFFHGQVRTLPMSTTPWWRRQRAAFALETRLAELEALEADGRLARAPPPSDCVAAFRAFAEGDNDNAIRILEPLMPAVVRIGGSHAQRELWEDTLIVACLRGGHGDKQRG